MMTSEEKNSQKRDSRVTELIDLVICDQSPLDREILLNHSMRYIKLQDKNNEGQNKRSKRYTHVVAAACYDQFKSNKVCAMSDFVEACKKL